MREDIEDLLNIFDETEEKEPDYMTVQNGDGKEPQTTPATPDTTDEYADSVEVEPDYAEVPETTSDSEGTSAYDKALEKVNKEYHNMLSGRFELIKVVNVYCPEEMQKNGKGKCDFIYEFTDKTPFGYVLGAPVQHKRAMGHASLTHYADKGWVVTEMDN